MYTCIIYIFLIIFGVIVLAIIYSRYLERTPSQDRFDTGSIPHPLPDGPYFGIVYGYHVFWHGKKFDAAQSTGVNSIDGGKGSDVDRYPFKTYPGKGIRDPYTDVLKIDYTIPGNPFWLRHILDEIVEVSPGHYLGKAHIVLIPKFPLTVGYFELKRE